MACVGEHLACGQAPETLNGCLVTPKTATGIELRQVQKGLLVTVVESRPVFTPAFSKLLGVLIREIGRNTMGRSCSPGTSM